MIKTAKQLFCAVTSHDLYFVSNIYGDQINYCSGSRPIWQCIKCSAIKFKLNLYKLPYTSPFAWAVFDGEGGYDLYLYEGNEDLKLNYIKRNGEGYSNWVVPLYE